MVPATAEVSKPRVSGWRPLVEPENRVTMPPLGNANDVRPLLLGPADGRPLDLLERTHFEDPHSF